jgi:hypothetical protein
MQPAAFGQRVLLKRRHVVIAPGEDSRRPELHVVGDD